MLPSLDLGHGYSITPGGLPKCPEALGDPAAGFRFRFRIDDIAKPEDNNGKYVRMIGANLDASPICGHLMTLGAPSLVVNAKVGDELILSSRFTGLGGDRLATTRTVADKQGNLLLAHVQNQGGPFNQDGDLLAGLQASLDPKPICQPPKPEEQQQAALWGTLRIQDSPSATACLFDTQTAGCCQLWGREYFVYASGVVLDGKRIYYTIYDPKFMSF